MRNGKIKIDFGWFSIIALVFVVLKLTGFISWSWWWVLSPLWIGAIIACAILGLIYWIYK